MQQLVATAVREHRVWRRRRTQRVRAVVAAALLLPGATGCYSYEPIWNAQPVSGAEVSLTLTDRGRVALSDRLGPGARTVSGRLASVEDSVYTLNVSGVTYIDSRSAKWTNETVIISKHDVGGIAERHLSRSRSWLAAGIAAGAIALASAIVIKGTAGPAPDTKPGGGGPQPQ